MLRSYHNSPLANSVLLTHSQDLLSLPFFNCLTMFFFILSLWERSFNFLSFLWLTPLSMIPSIFIHVARTEGFPLFSFLTSISLCSYVFIHFVLGNLSYFHILALMNSIVINIKIQIYLKWCFCALQVNSKKRNCWVILFRKASILFCEPSFSCIY